jgi:hypothetical protein
MTSPNVFATAPAHAVAARTFRSELGDPTPRMRLGGQTETGGARGRSDGSGRPRAISCEALTTTVATTWASTPPSTEVCVGTAKSSVCDVSRSACSTSWTPCPWCSAFSRFGPEPSRSWWCEGGPLANAVTRAAKSKVCSRKIGLARIASSIAFDRWVRKFHLPRFPHGHADTVRLLCFYELTRAWSSCGLPRHASSQV